MVVAPGRMIDRFLSIPDAESLPLYRMVLKLACVCVNKVISGATPQQQHDSFQDKDWRCACF